MQLHLIRHGQTDWNAIRRIQGQSESHLDTLGERQARELGQRLSDVAFRQAYVSTSARTRETAMHLLDGRDVPVAHRADLREMRLGRWETRLWDDVERDEPDEVRRYRDFDERFAVDGAESLSQMQARGLDALDDIVGIERDSGARADDHIAVVSHGFVLRAMLAALLERPLTDFAGSAGLPNCAHSIVEARPDGSSGTVYAVRTIDSAPPADGLWSAFLA